MPLDKRFGGEIVIEERVNWLMKDVFGPSTSNAVIYHLGVKGVGIKDVAQEPDKFMTALHDIFGVGAEMLEKRFAEGIGEALGIDSSGSGLREVVEKAKALERKGARKP